MADIVFRITQHDLRLGIGRGAHFDQVIETQRVVLAAIAHEDIEIGIDQRRLVAVRHLEGCRCDAIALVCLLFQLRMCGRIDKFDAYFALARQLIFPDQVA